MAAPAAVVETLAIPTAEGPMRVLLARPAGAGPWPAVVTMPHVGGLTDTMRQMAAVVAQAGYLSIVVDLYHRLGTVVIDPQSVDPEVVAIRKIAAASVTAAHAVADAGAAIRWAAERPDCTGRFATLGYGRGGSLALRVAAACPDQVFAAASILGFGFAEEGPEAAIGWLSRVRCPFYCAFAELDEIIPADVPAQLADLVDRTRADGRIVVHPGARHPYIFPDRAVYDPAAAARDWSAVFALFGARLSAAAASTG